MITLKQCKRDGQRLAITLADGDREESVYLGPQSVGSAFIQQESNAQELARLVVDAVNALGSTEPIQTFGMHLPPAPTPAETEPVVVPAKPTKRSGK
jgi:hypothetical protein